MGDGDEYDDVGPQQAEPVPQSGTKPSAVERRCFTLVMAALVLFNVLIFSGIIIRYLLFRDDLQSRYNELLANYSLVQNKPGVVKLCPDGWIRFGSSCYFKSTVNYNWTHSRTYCQNQRSDLVIINSREEQEFITKLSVKDESWIGLRTEWRGLWTWSWVDGSPLTETFGATGKFESPTDASYVAYCDRNGKLDRAYIYHKRSWICEK